jgi:hypothetical protein
MRRLCLTLLCGLVAVPAALGAAIATGDGVLELKAVNGAVVLNVSRGTLWGQMDRGTLVVTDTVADDGSVLVSGAETIKPISGVDGVKLYRGIDIHFRVTGGKVKLSFKGRGIDLTAVGAGSAQLTGDLSFDEAGRYSVDNGKWLAVPWLQRSVSFPAPVSAP